MTTTTTTTTTTIFATTTITSTTAAIATATVWPWNKVQLGFGRGSVVPWVWWRSFAIAPRSPLGVPWVTAKREATMRERFQKGA
eukprot:6374623-Pyramimonas_sp.AAC.1